MWQYVCIIGMQVGYDWFVFLSTLSAVFDSQSVFIKTKMKVTKPKTEQHMSSQGNETFHDYIPFFNCDK